MPLGEIIALPGQTGTGNMGDVTDRMSTARFRLTDGPYVPLAVRGKASGGTGSAELQMLIDHDDQDDWYNFLVAKWAGFGADGAIPDIYWRLPSDEIEAYILVPRQELVLTWTNPDADTMRWELQVTLARWISA